jgi:hydroxymethylpyrimidine/phosphomethylpyrimidine kinase
LKQAPARLLIIAGSDSSGGAGIQADIKTATALGVYAMTAITAVTVQDTTGIHAIHPVPAAVVRDQIACCLADIGADAIKIGMLGTAETVETVADILRDQARGIPLVLDPILASTSGTALLEERAISVLKEQIFPLVTMLTPNIPEAETLARMPVRNSDEMRSAAEKLHALGPEAVLVKGGHREGETVNDILLWKGGVEMFQFPRVHTRDTHGTGCTLATAIACELANEQPLPMAVRRAREFVQNALKSAPGFGRGHGPLNQMHGMVRD